MLPPRDAWRRNNLKVAEMMEETNKAMRSTQSRPPPPAYSANPQRISPNSSCAAANLITSDLCNPNEELVSRYEARLATSKHQGRYGVEVEGEGNHVVLTELEKPKQANSASSQPKVNDNRSAPPNHMSVNTHSRVELITAAVMEALKKADVASSNPIEIPRPIHLTINAGITIKGNKNVIYSGPRPAISRPSARETKQSESQSNETKPNDGSNREANDTANGSARKCRAQSEPLEE
ncbi:hypothetical protein H2198_001279 [Neophaeococcomyces mojaviensis]|uniref:Uncharacterized protein n=1 Tax=Neophaeococcomyces mojaviensis TaxID=3383035 RepID=A0ACC3AHG9_9EURO|nr:hypothetical protein H2198_001279 [Knufia sp. JES_112]